MKTFHVKVNGKEYEVEIEEVGTATQQTATAKSPQNAAPQASHSAIASTPQTTVPTQNQTDGKITAPMPGTVLRLTCTSGQMIKRGDTMLVLEAMKMENEIQAPADGKIASINVSEGQSVNAGDILVQLAV